MLCQVSLRSLIQLLFMLGMLLLVAACGTQETPQPNAAVPTVSTEDEGSLTVPVPAGWEVVYETRFDEETLDPRWIKAGGSWELGPEGLTGQGREDSYCVYDVPVMSDVRVETMVTPMPMPGASGGEVAFILDGSNFSFDTDGYFLSVGGSRIKLQRELVDVRKEEGEFLEFGRPYRIAAERRGGRITCEIDGKTVMTWVDPHPTQGPKSTGRQGLYLYNAKNQYRWFRILRRGPERTPEAREWRSFLQPPAREATAEEQAAMAQVREQVLALSWPAADAEKARQIMAQIREDGSFSDINYRDRRRAGWEPHKHCGRIHVLALAYGAPASPLYKNDAVREAAIKAMDFWFEQRMKAVNWWFNQIGVPLKMGLPLLVFEEALTEQQRAFGLEVMDAAKIGMTGQNRLWLCEGSLYRDLLRRDAEGVAKAFAEAAGVIRISQKEGIQADWSFHQHGAQLYSHGYGAAFLGSSTWFVQAGAGTIFEIPEEKVSLLTQLLLDGAARMTRGVERDQSANGRELTRDLHKRALYIATAARRLLAADAPRAEELQAWVAYLKRSAEADASVPPVPWEGNAHYWRSDYMVHSRDAWYASARMHSTRVQRSELVNDEGKYSHHLADGCTYIMQSGNEYAGITPLWNWKQIPGTTVLQNGDWSGAVGGFGESEFVGGVSDGRFGLAAMDLKRGPLAARKSWFFFDDVLVCLGAGIGCSSDAPVYTTLDQCRCEAKVAGEPEVSERPWAFNAGVAYLPLDEQPLHIERARRAGDWAELNGCHEPTPVEDTVFTAWFDHGVKPENAKYAYAAVPGVTAETASAYRADVPVAVLRNEPFAQVVRHTRNNATGMVFYRPGMLPAGGDLLVTAEHPCVVLLVDTEEGLAVHVADPTQKLDVTTLEISGQWEGEGAHELEDGAATRLIVALPREDGLAGSAVRFMLKRKGAAAQ